MSEGEEKVKVKLGRKDLWEKIIDLVTMTKE